MYGKLWKIIGLEMYKTFLDDNLFERQGKAITNFSETLPAEQSDLVQAIKKILIILDF